MSERIHALAQLLPGKNSLEECSVEELQSLAQTYPYFAPAQFLLLQKLKSEGSPDFEAQHRKAVLYYPDPLLFDLFVSSDKFYIDETVLQTAQPATAEAIAGPDTLTAIDRSSGERTFLPDPSPGNIRTEEERQKEKRTTEIPANSVPVSEDSEQTHTAAPEEPLSQPENGAQEEEPVLPLATAVDDGQQQRHNEDPLRNAGAITTATASVPAASAAPPNGEVLAFEPFHTVDYFASQGIKVLADDLTKDRLAKQMRSFTEWLKVMKRLPATEMAKSPESNAEKNVETLASHSVEESDVVTETMAEVWAKQGAREKAIETYNKLSLLNPSKKAYFAAKIENLKGS